MPMMGTDAFAKRHGLTRDQVSKMCRDGKIPGAEQDKKGSPWRIPEDAKLSEYKRPKSNKR